MTPWADAVRMSPHKGHHMKVGDKHYKAFVGPPEWYDRQAGLQFTVLYNQGLSGNHSLLDIGCGSLRAGKLFIPYLENGNYCGVEPEKWLVEEGIKHQLGPEIMELKGARVIHNDNFDFSSFNQKFDFILAQSLFTHAPQRFIHRCMESILQVRKPTTRFIVTWNIGDTDYTGDEWVYPKNIGYTVEFIANVASKYGFNHKRLTEFIGKWYLFS